MGATWLMSYATGPSSLCHWPLISTPLAPHHYATGPSSVRHWPLISMPLAPHQYATGPSSVCHWPLISTPLAPHQYVNGPSSLSPGSISGKSMWDMWCTNGYEVGFSLNTSVLPGCIFPPLLNTHSKYSQPYTIHEFL